MSQILQCIRQISHNAPFCNRNVHISVTKRCIVGYRTGALWDLCESSISTNNTHPHISPSQVSYRMYIASILEKNDVDITYAIFFYLCEDKCSSGIIMYNFHHLPSHDLSRSSAFQHHPIHQLSYIFVITLYFYNINVVDTNLWIAHIETA